MSLPEYFLQDIKSSQNSPDIFDTHLKNNQTIIFSNYQKFKIHLMI